VASEATITLPADVQSAWETYNEAVVRSVRAATGEIAPFQRALVEQRVGEHAGQVRRALARALHGATAGDEPPELSVPCSHCRDGVRDVRFEQHGWVADMCGHCDGRGRTPAPAPERAGGRDDA